MSAVEHKAAQKSRRGSAFAAGHPLADLALGDEAAIVRVEGPRVFRRRLMELGLLPGTLIKVVNVAPFGDPLELEVRGCRLSVRRSEAAQILVARPKRPLKVIS